MARCGEPATVRRDGAGAARQAGDGAAGGDWRRHLDFGTVGRLPSNDERRGYSVNIHVDRLNEAISDGDSVFAWKKSAMGHCCFISL